MSGLNDILATAHSALLAQQAGMNVTGSNIANAQNPNYSRQILKLSSTSTLNSGGAFLGTGVQLQSIQRGRDQLIDAGIWQEKAHFGYYESEDKYTAFVESVFNDLSGEGLSQFLDEFWNSWLELSNHPENSGARTSVSIKAQRLTTRLNNMDNQLRTLANQSQVELKNKIDDFNNLLKHIAKLNTQITRDSNNAGYNNALLDNRDSLINELSTYIDLKVVFHEEGSVTLFGSNQVLLDKGNTYELEMQSRNQDGQKEVYLSIHGGKELDIKDGLLKSLVKQSNISDELETLDEIAKNLVEQVNTLHKTFFDLKGETGKEFFVSTGIKAGSIRIKAEIIKDASNIAVSKDGQNGDGAGSLDIANVRYAKILRDGSNTIDESYQSLVSLVGQKRKSSIDNFEIQSGVVQALENQRQSIMGVSLEEEMINLIRYQNAFSAASRFIGALDEMLQTVINMV